MIQMNDETKGRIHRISSQGNYLNSREIAMGGIPFTVRELLVTAPHISGLNVYLVGGTGEGKTELANDLASLHGDSYCYAEGRPDFELRELLQQLNLQGLKEAKTDHDLRELTENVRKTLYYVDELNRCPPIVMNYFFNFFDGKLVHNGKVLRLGRNGYSVGCASGNIGNGNYVGISDTDRALRDRMNLIVKVDDPYFSTTEHDDARIFGSRKRLRASMPDTERACLNDVLALHDEFKQKELSSVLPLVGVYFHKGLDWLEGTPRHSKKAVEKKWPNVPGIRADTDEGKIMPLSKRAVLATIAYTQALEMVAEAKGEIVQDSVGLFLDALKLTLPYSGVFAENYIDIKHSGDVYGAYNEIMEGIKGEFSSVRREALGEATAFASLGVRREKALDAISPVNGAGKWAPVRRALEAEINAEPGEKKKTIDELLQEIKQGIVPAERQLWQTP